MMKVVCNASPLINLAWIGKIDLMSLLFGVRSLQRDLDAGESEAIGLALEIQADLLLMDEKMGREAAAFFEIRTLGVLGILTRAKQQKMVGEIKPLIDTLRSQAGFHIHQSLYQTVLQQNNETP